MKGLEDIISIIILHPIMSKTKSNINNYIGWIFATKEYKLLSTIYSINEIIEQNYFNM